MKQPYMRPAVTSLGSVQERTLQNFNKIGPAEDVYSASVPIVGSIKPI
jgi:hypothetical protein